MTVRRWQLAVLFAGLMAIPGTVRAQGFSGSVPATFSILNTSNAGLSGTLGAFSTTTIGTSTLVTSSLQFRLRSNDVYKLQASVGTLVGITAAAHSTTANAARDLTTGDIGFGITALDVSGANVVGGGGSPSRTDTIVNNSGNPNFSSPTWPTPSNGTVTYHATLHDIDSGATTIMTGDRISAGGDNSSTDNYVLVTVGAAILPQYFTAGAFSGTVTFTISAP